MSQDLLASKVVVFEEEPNVRSIPGAPTSVAGAVGVAGQGPFNKAVLCTSFDDYQATFGGFTPSSDLALAVMGFFENGGTQLWVARVASSGASPAAVDLVALSQLGAPTAASITGTTPAPFELESEDQLAVEVGPDTFTLTFEGNPAEIENTRTEPFSIADGQTLFMAIDGGPPQTVIFTAGQFADIGAATAQEVADAINAAMPNVVATADEGVLTITTVSAGTASRIVVAGGSAVGGAQTHATVTGTEAPPFDLSGETENMLTVEAGSGSYTLTFEGGPAEIENTRTEPYALVDGLTFTLAVDGAAPQTLTFHTADFADIGAVTASELADAINSHITGVNAVSTEDGDVFITTLSAGTASSLEAGGTAVDGDGTPASVTGSIPAPFAIADTDQLQVTANGNVYTLTFSGSPATVVEATEVPHHEPFALEDGLTLILSVDGGPNQTVIFSAGDFDDIENATADEIAAAIDAQVTGVVTTATSGTFSISTTSLGTASSLSVVGGTAVGGGATPAIVSGSTVPPFTLSDGDELIVDFAGTPTTLTFNASPALIRDTSETPHVEPFALEDGFTIVLEVDGGANQTVTFNAEDFADISAATAAEVCDAINAQTTDLLAEPDSGAITIASLSRGTASSIEAVDGTALFGVPTPAMVAGTSFPPFSLNDGDQLIVDADGTSYPLTFAATPAEVHDTSDIPRVEPFLLEDGMTLTLVVDGGSPQTVTFTSGDFTDISAATASEVALVIDMAITGAVASASSGGLSIETLSKGTASTLEITGGTAVDGDPSPARIVTASAPPFALTNLDTLQIFDETHEGSPFSVQFLGGPAVISDTSGSPVVEPYALQDGMTLFLKVNGGSAQTVTFHTADFTDITAATAAEVAAAISGDVLGATAAPISGGKFAISTVKAGTSATLQVTGGTAVDGDDLPARITGNVPAPLPLDHGYSLAVLVNPGATTVTIAISATAASVETTNSSPFTLTDGDTLEVQIDGGSPQTVTFHTADFEDISGASSEEIAAVLTLGLTGADLNYNRDTLTISSSVKGTSSYIEVTGGTAVTALGLEFASGTGSGNVSNASAVEASDLQSLVVAAGGDPYIIIIDEGPGIEIVSIATGSSVYMSATGSIASVAGFPAGDHFGFAPDRLGIMSANESGDGNVANISAVTIAEVASLAATAGVTADIHVNNIVTAMELATISTGSTAKIRVAGSARTHFGFDPQLHIGGAGVSAPAIVVGLAPAPYAIANNDQVVVTANGSTYTATFLGTAAAVEDTTRSEPFDLANGMAFGLTVDGGSTQTVTFHTGDFVDITAATAAEVAAAIDAQVTGVHTSVTSGKIKVESLLKGTLSAMAVVDGTAVNSDPTARVTGTTAPPFTVSNGDALNLDLGDNEYTFVFFQSPARIQDTSQPAHAEPFALADGQTLIISVNGALAQTVTFHTADFVDISAATAAEVVAVITAGLTGATASDSGGLVVVETTDVGSSATLAVTGGSAAGTLGLTSASATGDGNVADLAAVTIAEISTIIAAAVQTDFVINNLGTAIEFQTVAEGPTATITASGVGATAMGLDGDTHVGHYQDRIGLAGLSSTGTGNVPDLSAVSSATVVTVITAAGGTSDFTAESFGIGTRLVTTNTGSIASIQATGAAATTIGFDGALHVGSDDDRLGLFGQAGSGGGNVASINGVTVSELSTIASDAGGDADFYINDLGTAIQLVTVGTGSGSSIQVTGTAGTSMGIDTDMHLGTDGASSPAVLTGTTALPFALTNGDTLTLDVSGSSYGLTFTSSAGAVTTTRSEPFFLEDNMTMTIEADGGAYGQTVYFSAMYFADISAATAAEVADQINGQFYFAALATANMDGTVTITSLSTGTSSSIVVTGGSAISHRAPVIVDGDGTSHPPFTFTSGTALNFAVNGTNFNFTLTGTGASIVCGNSEPYALADGNTQQFKIDSDTVYTVTFHTADFADIGAATAAEVAAVINAQLPNVTAAPESGKVRVTSHLVGNAARVTGWLGSALSVFMFFEHESEGSGTLPNILSTSIADIQGLIESVGGQYYLNASYYNGVIRFTTVLPDYDLSTLQITGGAAAVMGVDTLLHTEVDGDSTKGFINGTVPLPMAVSDGDSITVTVVDGTGSHPFTSTIDAQPGVVTSTLAEPYHLEDGMYLSLSINALPTQTVTFHTADFDNIEAATAAEIASVVTAQLTQAEAIASSGSFVIQSTTGGTTQGLLVLGGDSVEGVDQTAVMFGTVSEPFAITSGEHLIVALDSNTYDEILSGGPASLLDHGVPPQSEPFPLSDGMTLTIAVDGGSTQTVTFHTGSFVSIGAATALEIAAVINAQMTGVLASGAGGVVQIDTLSMGYSSSLDLTGGTAVSVLGFTLGVSSGAGNVASVDAVPISDIASIFSSGSGDFTISSASGVIKLETVGTGSTVTMQVSGGIGTSLGLDTDLHTGSDGDALGLFGQIGNGDGNVANSNALTLGDITNVVGHSGDAYYQFNDIGTGVQLATAEAGSEVSITASGTLATVFGLDIYTHFGADSDRLGLAGASGFGDGNVTSIGAVTLTDIANVLSDASVPVVATDIGTGIRFTTVDTGSAATIQASGSATTPMGLDTDLHRGSDADRLGLAGAFAEGEGNVEDIGAVRADEVIQIGLDAGDGSFFTISDLEGGLELRSVETGLTATLQVSGSARVPLGFDDDLHAGGDSDRLGIFGRSGTGDGNVADLNAVTVAEVAGIATDEGGDADFTVTDAAPGIRFETVDSGSASTLQIGLSAAAELGLDTDLHVGTDGDLLGYSGQSGSGTGNVGNINAVGYDDIVSVASAAGGNADFHVVNLGTAIQLTTVATGQTAHIQVSDGAAAVMGFDSDLHVGTDSDVLGLSGLSDQGDGNVGNISAVTIAEVANLASAAGGNDAFTVEDVGSMLRLTTLALGADATIQVSGDTPDPMGLDTDLHSGSDDQGEAPAPVVHVEASERGASGNRLSVHITPPTDDGDDEFDLLVYQDGTLVETFENLSRDSDASRFIEDVVNNSVTGSQLITVTNLSDVPWDAPIANTYPLVGGGDADATDVDFIGDEDEETGLHALDEVQDLSLVFIPGLASPAVHNGMLEYCEQFRDGTVFAILDPPAGIGAADMVTYVTETASLENASEYGAIYWPRVKVLNPSKSVFGLADQIVVPPSGIIAGVYARTDGARPGGVYDPPAGVDTGLMFGVLGFENNETLEERKRDLVYPRRINPLTTSPGLPRYIDGSRTLKGTGSFPFIAERRGVMFIEESLQQGLAFVRHKNNTPELRARVRRTITSFLITQMNNGAFRSKDPAKAFFVDVSDQLNPPSEVLAGKLNIRIGLATNKPAEFVILEISQDTRALDAELAGAG